MKCCDWYDDPRHPKGDPTCIAHCATCGFGTRQSYNRDSRGEATAGYTCGLCAEKAFHANPPTEPLPARRSWYVPPTEPQEIGDMPAWMTGEDEEPA